MVTLARLVTPRRGAMVRDVGLRFANQSPRISVQTTSVQGPVTVSGFRRPATACACLAGLLGGGCGHSAPAKEPAARGHTASASHTECLTTPRDAIARFLKLSPGSIALAASTGNNDMPQCSFSARVARKRRVDATVNVNSGAQPYFVLERTAIEAAQQFGAVRLIAAPQAVTGLGLEADWFPAETQLMTTDGIRLITVSVRWRDSTRKRVLAEALARAYLKHSKQGRSRAKGYP
jgi:hypothetical protein